nr:MAG TPA: hypothetical protein [Caudoviricetes sp.]
MQYLLKRKENYMIIIGLVLLIAMASIAIVLNILNDYK